MKLADYACRAVLRLYPRHIRDAHAAEMRETFLEVCATRSSIPELGNLAVSAVKARAGYPRIPSGQEPMQTNNTGGWLNAFSSDLRQAFRALVARPGSTAMAVALLALAIAACTSVFTVADAVIFNPVPYRNADRIVPIGIARTPGAWPNLTVTPDLVRAWRDSGVFERIEVHASLRGTTLDEGIEPRSVHQSWITPGTLDMLGAAPIRGRAFTADDAIQPVPPALIAESLWRSQFGGDPGIVGRRVSIEGKPTEIIGILASDFRFPLGRRGLWRPLDINRGAAERMQMWAVGLLRADIPRDEARQRAHEATQAAAPAAVKAPAAVEFAPALGLRSFDAYTVNAVKVLFAGVSLVLLIACVNVANLLLAQALGRSRERSVKAALGASRGRLIRQAFLESALLATVAAAAGLFLSWMAVSSFETLLPEYLILRGANAMDLDGRALTLTLGLTFIATIAAGFLPAWFGTRVSPGSVLKDNSRGATESRAARRLASTLVIGEVAVAVALLVSASLLVRSFITLATADRGIKTEGIVGVWLGMPEHVKTSAEARMVLSDELHRRFAALDGVKEVIRLRSAPPDGADIYFSALKTDDGRSVEGLEVLGFHVPPAFFGFFEVQLAAGRFLRAGDPPEAVVIGERLAAALWPGTPNPIGRTFRIGSGVPREVVGVSREMLTPLLDPRVDRPELFQPVEGTPTSRFMLKLTSADAVRADQIKAVVRAVHPSYLVHEAASIDAQYREQIEGPETAARIAAAFAAFGMIVCAAGLFSVLSLSVARRRREFGIRLAVGGHPSDVSRLVIRQTAWTLAAGIVLGALGAYALARNLSSVLAGVDVTDVTSWTAVITIIALAGAAAAWLPVRSARCTDPLLLLREE